MDKSLCLRAVYSPVNQAWFVILGKKGDAIEKWSQTDINGRRLWQGKTEGRIMLVEDLARVGLRLIPGKANVIVTE